MLLNQHLNNIQYAKHRNLSVRNEATLHSYMEQIAANTYASKSLYILYNM